MKTVQLQELEKTSGRGTKAGTITGTSSTHGASSVEAREVPVGRKETERNAVKRKTKLSDCPIDEELKKAKRS